MGNPELVKDLNGNTSDSNIRFLTSLGDRVYFSSDAGGDGYELWESDGTVSGTTLVVETASNRGVNPIPLGRTSTGGVYFVADSPSGRGLYRKE